jgi:circadian clock protein KaiB
MAAVTTTEEPRGTLDRIWDLCLYVYDQTPRSVRALKNLKNVCEKHLAGRYRIELVDLAAQPERAVIDQIIAIPTVVRRCPLPIRTTIGDLSDAQRVLAALDFRQP